MAAHLLNVHDNEHVEVHEVSGFLSDTVRGALDEIYAASRGTRCKQYLFSVSLNPPAHESAPVEYFETTLAKIEKTMGLKGQPRVVVFHEKDGRRHAHCIWSRINARTMKAVNLPHYKRKLNDLSKRLYLQYGWELPQGFIDHSLRDPNNFTHEEWQQSKRTEVHPAMTKMTLKTAWEQADNRSSFENALHERGFRLAQGDKRGFVVMDTQGEIYSLSRMLKLKTKDLTQKLGDADNLPSVAETLIAFNKQTADAFRNDIVELKTTVKEKYKDYLHEISVMKWMHTNQRRDLEAQQKERKQQEDRNRSARMPRGLRGIWLRITGKYGEIRTRNEQELQQCHLRDREERQRLIEQQLRMRRELQERVIEYRRGYQELLLDFRKEIGRYEGITKEIHSEIEKPQRTGPNPPKRKRSGPSFEPGM
ncbi:relaxase [bacterium]|nr:relaxase [bacterium]